MPTQGEIDSAKAELEELRSQADEIKEKSHGMLFKTNKNLLENVRGMAKEIVLGDHLVKIEGGYTKVLMGTSKAVNVLFKGEYIQPLSNLVILILEAKVVVGLLSTTITGLKREKIIGAKFDYLHGTKFEKKASSSTDAGDAPELKKEGKISEKVTKAQEKIGSFIGRMAKLVTKVGRETSKAGELDEEIKKIDEMISKLDANYKDAEYEIENWFGLFDDWQATSDNLTIEGKTQINGSNYEAFMACYKEVAMMKKGETMVSCGDDKILFKGSKSILK